MRASSPAYPLVHPLRTRRLLRLCRVLHPAVLLSWLVVPVVVYLASAYVPPTTVHYGRSSPRHAQTVASPPSRVHVSMDAGLGAHARFAILVSGPDGSLVDDGATIPEDAAHSHFSVGLIGALIPGRYVARFQT